MPRFDDVQSSDTARPSPKSLRACLSTNIKERASATSSLSAGSSSDHSSDHNDYDHPRPHIDVGTALQPPAMVRTTPPGRQPQPQVIQLRPAQLMQRSVLATGEKNEFGSSSVLQNVFEGLGVERNRAVDEDDSRFSRSLNLDSHLSANPRSPSIPPETMYGIRTLSDDRQRRVTNVAPEVLSTQRTNER
uniref:Similar to n=1 Tax=Ascaris lumbricoides TaxID=6252 RepID=A0A0M3IUJ2_ASCLU